MEQRTAEINQAKGKMISDIKTVITDSENLLMAAANASGASLAAVREKIDQKLCGAKGMLLDASRPVVNKARQAATTTNNYVHDNPWAVIGLAVTASALFGYWAAKR